MDVLLIGAGGREHSLAWSLAKSPRLGRLYAAPGNAGIARIAELVDLDITSHADVIAFCHSNDIGFVVVGPEAPLVAGLVDDLSQAGIRAFGPGAKAAQLEGSKGFTKEMCTRAGVPTAAYGRFQDAESARAYVARMGAPIVVKADGLAAGKGVVVAQNMEEALAAVEDCFAGTFGDAGAEVVIEECMVGEEASFFVLSDGDNILPLVTAQDHKRAHDGDRGPNTGGMGAYSPAPVMTDTLVRQTIDEIIKPTIADMRAQGHPFKGVLYAGLMITESGPRLIEYNVRFGDPECQVMLMMLKSDLLSLLLATTDGTLDTIATEWIDGVALTVVMAAKGYPGAYDKGTRINGLTEAATEAGVEIFHAGTRQEGDVLLANGGRVLNVTALGATARQARDKAYAAIEKIDWPEGFCRSDIGWRAVEREEE